MAEKSEVTKLLKNFCVMAKIQFDKHVKVVRSDNETEFAPLRSYIEENGIEFQTSCVDTPQQNGRMERKHRHILNVGRALHFQANLPLTFWATLVASIDNSPSAVAYDVPLTHHSPSPLDLSNSLESGSENVASPQVVTTSNRETVLDSHHPQDLVSTFDDTGSPSCVLRRSERSRQPNTRLKDYVCLTAHCVDPSASPTIQSSSSAITVETEPNRFVDAVKDPRWCDAMAKEIAALESNRTWTIEDLPPGTHAIGFVVARGWALHQMDVHNAFLHGDLDEEVYMQLPPGFSISTPGKVCRLRKSLYGLRQAPDWFAKLAGALESFGFQQSYADYSLFTYERQDVSLHVLIYVDDLIIAGNNLATLSKFKDYLSHCFHMKDLDLLKYFLGIEIARGPDGLFLTQRKCTLDILSEVGFLDAKPTDFPIEQNHNLSLDNGPLFVDPARYRRLIGRLIYLTITRPKLCYIVHILAQFMNSPRDAHWEAALRVLRYLKGHPGQDILLRHDSVLHLNAYCDSDWASYPLTRHSLTGYFILLGDSPISWKTKKQPTVSRSSAEAEYHSIATASCELTWLKSLLRSLGVSHSQPMRLFCDSQAALHIAANPVFHERAKHREVDCHYVRDQIQAGTIVTTHVCSQNQLADIFTKALGRQQFTYLLRKLGIRDPHAPTLGGVLSIN
ncbi:UNVERIFIED_CONTAM: Retrovirus-related Pol polyprotein from transposon RE2 [Sesamum radiatum]|uniref:Retrovirus-related Pol polyprotein from transposon RE2 n=1 Tax=Sesamum radiatum TaxID=300843 RepID=A0AAW2TI91_SESRA